MIHLRFCRQVRASLLSDHAAQGVVGRHGAARGHLTTPLASSLRSGMIRKKSVATATSDLSVNSRPSSEEKVSLCPFTGTNNKEIPKLVEVPMLPFVGSTLHQYSGTPPFDMTKFFDYCRDMQERFGSFYVAGMPGFGQGVFGRLYSITDPDEMLKVIRAEGSHPSGIVAQLWPLSQAFKDDNSPMFQGNDYGLLGQGELWKKQRTFLQTGMLDPLAAKAFVPGIAEAAEMASKGAIHAASENKINYFLNRCAFDMFCSFMFGELTQCADQSKNRYSDDVDHEENVMFCKSAIAAMEGIATLLTSPKENFAHQLGYKTARYKAYYEEWKIVKKIGLKKLNAFAERYERGELLEHELNSYMANALSRLESGVGAVSYEEMMEMAVLSLFAGVDTTSGVVGWNLVHIALNPMVQDKLYEELVEAVKLTGGKITAKTLEKKSVPYLHAILRETYRITPPFGNIGTKVASKGDVNIHGVSLPKGSVVSLENKFNRKSVLADAFEFKPERWMPDAIQARVGTDHEVMDHPLLRDTFGQGARRCPGNRVATNELLILLSQLVLDYKILPPEAQPGMTFVDVKYYQTATLTPSIPQFRFIPRSENTMTN